MMMAAAAAENGDHVGLRTVRDAGRFLGISKTQIYRLCRSGDLELVKIGPQGTRVTQASIDRYISNAKRVTTTSRSR